MNDLKKIVNNFKGKKIAVVGDIILDKYIFGEVERISPEAPVPVVQVTDEKYVPGGAANVACNLIALGAETSLLGITGEDEDRDILLGSAELLGIDTAGIITDETRKTIKKTRVIGMNQQLLRIDFEDNEYIESFLENAFMEKLSSLKELNAVIVSDYAKGVITDGLMQKIKTWCRENSVLLVVDPKPRHKGWYKDVDLITPNKLEAHVMSGIHIENEDDYRQAVAGLSKELETSVVLTAGAGGMYVLNYERLENGDRRQGLGDRRKETGDDRLEAEDRRTGPGDRRQRSDVKHIPTIAREVYDVSGAGDTVVAALTLAICSGADINMAAEIANHAAGIKVGKLGAAAVSLQELLDDLGMV
ncbi:bifunctional heptose 7-phosphate kinase/heptose 1-phosphate adenyltransferase [Candidatus Cloacimonadota bacterium]